MTLDPGGGRTPTTNTPPAPSAPRVVRSCHRKWLDTGQTGVSLLFMATHSLSVTPGLANGPPPLRSGNGWGVRVHNHPGYPLSGSNLSLTLGRTRYSKTTVNVNEGPTVWVTHDVSTVPGTGVSSRVRSYHHCLSPRTSPDTTGPPCFLTTRTPSPSLTKTHSSWVSEGTPPL